MGMVVVALASGMLRFSDSHEECIAYSPWVSNAHESLLQWERRKFLQISVTLLVRGIEGDW